LLLTYGMIWKSLPLETLPKLSPYYTSDPPPKTGVLGGGVWKVIYLLQFWSNHHDSKNWFVLHHISDLLTEFLTSQNILRHQNILPKIIKSGFWSKFDQNEWTLCCGILIKIPYKIIGPNSFYFWDTIFIEKRTFTLVRTPREDQNIRMRDENILPKKTTFEKIWILKSFSSTWSKLKLFSYVSTSHGMYKNSSWRTPRSENYKRVIYYEY